ncbi:putative disease resistance protein RGA3 [Papaver somniferum]|uniref:putative disease resistance protein RGA3 n=1 Tax=Papaver somniferum TaxID=3469 RepID=UPI000E703DCB|nr:putative disease resistance protein RGA3 [Papaver somniferum]
MDSEGVLVSGLTEIVKKLPVISQHISPAWGVTDDLRKLLKTLESIQALISDAEEKQINNATVGIWLRRLKDVVYDVDDVMDEICYETMRHSERENNLKLKVRNFISKSSNPLVFHFKMVIKIRGIKKDLDEIYNDQVRYSLNATGTSQVDQTREQRNRLTTSVIDDSVFIGRENAISDIVKTLTNKLFSSVSPSLTSSDNSSFQKQLSVVSIMGMGGLGKTSLAQMVYQDKSIETHFKQKMWVCVSDKFDVYRILKEILESITGVSCGDHSNVDVLARQVKKKLMGKNYLLVLDDLWNGDAKAWEKLKEVLVNGGEGSKLLVTTRSQKVASIVGGKVHNLQKLTDDACWSIMQKKNSFPGGAALTKNMSNIGRGIAKKCDGLPLAANFLGSLLYLNRDESYWNSINNDNNLWFQPENKRVISILKLSYDNLSSPLKQCFSYCSLFPKDWEIERAILIRMWMAEGFIHLPADEVNNRSLEDIGNDYFEFLLRNSFFQDVKKDEIGVILRCKMHTLVHDLAMSVVDRNEFGFDGKEVVSLVRRIQLVFDIGSSTTNAEVLSEAKKLRSVIVLHPEYCSQVSSFSSVERLRTLYPLGGWYAKISFSIPKFKHLRFLDLSNCEFDLAPDVSLSHSHNLQTLILHRCKNVSGFLRETGALRNLRHLDVSKSDIEALPNDFIVSLTNLQTLDLYECIQFEALPEQISFLKHLRHLNLAYSSITQIHSSISCITNLMALNFEYCWNLDALPRELGALTRLRCLDLSYTKIKVLPESCISNLCNLEIVDFGFNCGLPREIKNWRKLRRFTHHREGDNMPRGMEKLTCLETLCSYMVRKEADVHSGIKELAVLNSLQVLYIERLQNVRGGREDAERAKLKDKKNLKELYLTWSSDEDVEDDDMVFEGLRPHSNLRKLEIRGFSGLNLPKWMGSSSNCLLLVSLSLQNCNSCENLPALGMLQSLKTLLIQKMKSVKFLGREFYYQQQQEEEESRSTQNSATTASSLFPCLVELIINNMENLEEWVAPPPSSNFCANSFPLLESLYMQDCPKLRSAPNSFSSLKELRLMETNGKAVNSILSAGGCLTFLTSIDISESPELIYFPLGVLLQNNTPNLHSLTISNCSDFQGFRDDIHVSDSSSSRSSSSLHVLALISCPVLTSLPDLRFWTSLRRLSICECHKLKESIPYDLNTLVSFLDLLEVDFIEREDEESDEESS